MSIKHAVQSGRLDGLAYGLTVTKNPSVASDIQMPAVAAQ
jgi:hypothetical protein